MVEVSHSPIVVALCLERLDEASRVALIGPCHAVADLLPQILSALATAARSKQVVIELVVACGIGTIEYSRRSSFETDYNSGVGLIGKDVPTQTIGLPAKIIGIVEAALNG